ncbi:MAG: ankyrin repeat domain-containing protein, partial [Alphaproteobacteria bacterium]|nr:ankyrin repeat domain-containing protein [Alphaproteobacteria bacterium]
LHYAVFMGKLEAVKALLTAGANPNQENDLGLTPLQMAQWCAKDANASNLEGGELSMQQRSPIAAQLLQAASDRAVTELAPQEYLIPAYQ